MRIVAGFLRSPEGRAALQRAIEEARLRDAELLVVHSAKGGQRDEIEEVLEYREEFERLEQQLNATGVTYRLKEFVRGNAPSEDLLQVAKDEDADLIVLGIRRRSPVGKLVLGSNAQDVLLNADCAVLAVKASLDDRD
jgi:nucleotide-binding universal stress UspA family protein